MESYVQRAFARKMESADFFRSLEWPRLDRIKKYPLATLNLFITGAIFKFLIYKAKIKNPLVSATTFWGDKMKIVFPDNRAVYHYGVLDGGELPVTKFIVDYLKEGDIFLDAGAHTGYYALLASKIVGSNGSVHAFEPTPRTFGILKSNILTNKRGNTVLNQKALLDSPRKIEITDFGIRRGGLNSVLSWDELPDGFVEIFSRERLKIKKISAEGTTVDEYCKERNIHPNFMKIDTEGAEYLLLRGAERTLKNDHPIIVMEIWRDKGREGNFRQVRNFLEKLSYEMYQFDGNFELAPCGDGQASRFTNFVFIPKDGSPRRR